MDRSRQTYSALADLKQIREEARRSDSLDDLRDCYERLQNLRRAHVDDFDFQLSVAEAQEEIIEKARRVREKPRSGRTREPEKVRAAATSARAKPATAPAPKPAETPEVPPDVQRVDEKTWQRATYLALFFTLLICAGFFYLIQTARRINMPAPEKSNASGQSETSKGAGQGTAQIAVNTASPALRLYTDLVPATVSVDEAPPQDLKDGELILDRLKPGRHSIKVVGRNGNAGFSFDVSENAAPRVVGSPVASNAMAVLVSVEDKKAHLVTTAEKAQVALDGKAIGEVGSDGLVLGALGKIDHDIQVSREKDRQRFVLTYTAGPSLTAYVKSDPNAGTVVVIAGQDGADVFINEKPYRRKTDHGQVRIPLKVGEYTIRVHKDGFIDPPQQTVTVKKAEETPLEFRLDPAPQIATLQIRGALPGTMVYLDNEFAALIGTDGNANVSNVKPGQHTVELRRDQALPKKFERTFTLGEVVSLSGTEVALEKVVTEAKPPPQATPPTAPAETPKGTQQASTSGLQLEGEQVRRGGGFVPYHTTKVPGRYFFQAQGRLGGFLRRSKLQWYAAYKDPENYVLFVVDGKRATVRDIRDGKATDVARVPFDADSNEWVQVDLSVKSNQIDSRIKTTDTEWQELGSVKSEGRDFTQGKVGFYIPGNDEIAISNFRFSSH